MGSTPTKPVARFTKNFDMAADDPDKGGLMLHGWPRTKWDDRYNGKPPWWHGDYKDVAYIYVQELYKKWVELSK